MGVNKIKFFKSDSLTDLENQINRWLETNPHIKIWSGEITDYNAYTCYAVLWWYTI